MSSERMMGSNAFSPNNSTNFSLPPTSNHNQQLMTIAPHIQTDNAASTTSPVASQSDNPGDQNANKNIASGVSAGKFLSLFIQVANWISGVRKTVEKYFTKCQNFRNGITSLEVTNWKEVEEHFRRLHELSPDEVLVISPPDVTLKINDIPAVSDHKALDDRPMTISEYINNEVTETDKIIRKTRSAIIGGQMRVYVNKRRASGTGSGTRLPRNTIQTMSTKLHCTNLRVRQYMLWSRLVEVMPSLVVSGEDLFHWILKRGMAVSSKSVENFLVETACTERSKSIQVTNNIQVYRLLGSKDGPVPKV